MPKTFLIILFGLFGFFFFACEKNEMIDTGSEIRLGFSKDTVMFDTVFTSIGSSTRKLMIYNKSENRIKISNIKIAGGTNSPYRMNVDGINGNEVKNLEIAGKDSAYVFVKVTIDPTDVSAPFVRTDSILFETNGNRQNVKLVSWGQNAHFYNKAIVKGNQIFEADKPHIIYNYLIIDQKSSLTIKPGVKIYMHNGAILAADSSATLKIKGTFEEPVTIQGDRLEKDYQKITGQWNKIWLTAGSTNNEIEYAVIKNGTVGVHVDSLGTNSQPTLKIHNTQIYNMTDVGLYARGAKITASNCVFANAGQSAVAFQYGGNYDLRHCTLANYWLSLRKMPALYVSNYLKAGDVVFINPLENAYFGNCIIYGSLDNELLVDDQFKTQSKFSYKFENCLFKTKVEVANSENFNECVKNLEPYFPKEKMFSFKLDSLLSAAINRGSMQVINTSPVNITKDHDSKSRTADGKPDLGAYEFQPKK